MRKLLTLTFLCIGIHLFAQKPETVHVKDIDCEYDTTAVVLSQSISSLVGDAQNLHIEFTKGNHKMLHVKVYTTECRCVDCSELFELALNIDSLILNEIHYLKREEVIWIYDNAWIDAKEIKNYLGYVKYLGDNLYELKISEMLNATVIRSIHLNLEAKE